MKWVCLSFVIGTLLINTACGGRAKPTTLGQLKYKQEKEEQIAFKTMGHEDVRKEYEELLDLFEDKNLKEQIERRIADVYMMEGVQDQLKDEPKKSYYIEAIKSYRDILEKYPDSPDNAEVFYQLAKAYDMEGEQGEALHMLTELTSRHPTYKNIAEAYFRMGDIYFNLQQYAKAERAYIAVTQSATEKLSLNARYMLGWSYYKQLKFDDGLTAFASVLTEVLGDKNNLDDLDKSEKPFAEDSLRSISLTLARSGGAEMIATAPQLANKDYIWMIYENLGEYYLEKERFEDSAFTYRLFVTQHKNSEQAPRLHKRLIDSYIDGGFPLRAIEEKEVYVDFYGISSSYSGNKNGLREDLKAPLKQYIDELARHYHSSAQALQKNLSDIADGKVVATKSKQKSSKELMVTAFDNAASFYKQYIATFPKDERIGEMTFLQAEAHFAAFRYALAIAEYEKVAYDLTDAGHKKYGADAGYAAIISYQNLIDPLKSASKEAKAWQQKAVESMLRFAGFFHADPRSPSVLTNAAEYLFGLDQYAKALQVSSDLISKNPALDDSLKKTAYGIMAHSHYQLKNYQAAEENYFNQRQLVAKGSEEYGTITERLATTIYKKTEAILAGGDKITAIKELIKIKVVAPNSPVRITAQYDAATMMLELEQWQPAITEFQEMRKLFPEHALAVEFPRKTAFALEKMESWLAAGASYLELSQIDPDAEVRREALFVAANMYEKAADYEQAIELFKDYARQHEQPFGPRMEARYHLALNYENLGDKNRKLYWLRRLVAGDKEGGSERNERSRWLAAWANIEYGDYFAWEFRRKSLRLPLDKSLPSKNKALKDAVSRYQLAADYEILEFVSMSSFKIAGLYEQFAKELRGVAAPKGMNGEQTAMYRQIIEEQASPFVELAAELHSSNIELAWAGHYNEWIEQSFAAMRELNPERFSKQEYDASYGDEIR